MAWSTAPTTRSAVFDGLLAFQLVRKLSSLARTAFTLSPLPQKLPPVITFRPGGPPVGPGPRSRSVGLISYRTPAVEASPPTPAGSGRSRDSVLIPFWMAALALLENCVENVLVPSPIGT